MQIGLIGNVVVVVVSSAGCPGGEGADGRWSHQLRNDNWGATPTEEDDQRLLLLLQHHRQLQALYKSVKTTMKRLRRQCSCSFERRRR